MKKKKKQELLEIKGPDGGAALPESKGQNLALTGSFIQSSLDSTNGNEPTPASPGTKDYVRACDLLEFDCDPLVA